MKKIIFIGIIVLLVAGAALAVVFALRGEGEIKGVSEEKWNAMLAEHNFDNYTLTQSGYVIQKDADHSEEIGSQQDSVIKFTQDKVRIDVTQQSDEHGELTHTQIYTGEDVALQKNAYSQIFLALLGAYDNYEYDAVGKVYNVTKAVTVDLKMGNEDIKIVMNEGKVTLSDDGMLSQFICDYTQTMVNLSMIIETKMTWTFSDYGTTVISEDAQ